MKEKTKTDIAELKSLIADNWMALNHLPVSGGTYLQRKELTAKRQALYSEGKRLARLLRSKPVALDRGYRTGGVESEPVEVKADTIEDRIRIATGPVEGTST